jgi:hypothetical protein
MHVGSRSPGSFRVGHTPVPDATGRAADTPSTTPATQGRPSDHPPIQRIGRHRMLVHEKPVYRFEFTSPDAYKKFVHAMEAAGSGLDLTGGIRFHPDELHVDVHYFPRVAKNLLFSQMDLHGLLEDGVLANIAPTNAVAGEDFALRTRDAHANPYLYLHRSMTVAYAEVHRQAFQAKADAWDASCNGVDTGSRLKLCDTGFPRSGDYVSAQMDQVATQSFFVGEDHYQVNARGFIRENLRRLSERGFRTVFLEGIPVEAQELIDAYYAGDTDELPPDLQRMVGSWADVLVQTKELGMRVVGLSSRQTYDDAPDNMADYAVLRAKAMNQEALEIIRREAGEHRYVALVGADHLIRATGLERTPGLAAVLKVPAVMIGDAVGMEDDEFGVISGADDVPAKLAYAAQNRFTAMNPYNEPGYDLRIEAAPGAQIPLGD